MTQPSDDMMQDLVDRILAAPRKGALRLVAIAGPPAGGKSTLAQALIPLLATQGCRAQVVPMDGFHLDNRLLKEAGLLGRKGAPETFDIEGLKTLVARLAQGHGLIYPLFDRTADHAVAGAGRINDTCDTVIIEGNYLLLDAPGWADLAVHWDLTVFATAPESTLRARLIARWVDHGLPAALAEARAQHNDLRNAALVIAQSRAAHVTL